MSAMTETKRDPLHAPKGERKCEDCEFYHPERKKPCSAFGQCENKDGYCSLYIGTRSRS